MLSTCCYFMAALSVNLALINLLPIPVLDGGHLLLYAIEAVTRQAAQQAGRSNTHFAPASSSSSV